jgi:hypothetical protein
MNTQETKTLILELKNMCNMRMNKDGVKKLHRVGVYDQFDIKLKKLERSAAEQNKPKFPEYDYVREMFPKVDTVLFSSIYHAIKYAGNFT